MSLFSGGNVSGIENSLTSLVPQFSGLASTALALEPNFLGLANTIDQQVPGFLNNAATLEGEGADLSVEGNLIYGPAEGQFAAGAAGQVTPEQQAAIDQTLKQLNLSTEGTYANLGLGGSTMETQDTGANKLASLAQKSEFSALDEQLGLSGLQSALGYNQGATQARSAATQARSGAVNALNTENAALGGALSTVTGAGNILSGATGALNTAGGLAAGQQAQQLSALSNLGSSLGGKGGGGAGADVGTAAPTFGLF